MRGLCSLPADSSYELQLNPSVRGQGLGGRLMDELESIGRAQSMSKAMLTCLAGELYVVTTLRQATLPHSRSTKRLDIHLTR